MEYRKSIITDFVRQTDGGMYKRLMGVESNKTYSSACKDLNLREGQKTRKISKCHNTNRQNRMRFVAENWKDTDGHYDQGQGRNENNGKSHNHIQARTSSQRILHLPIASNMAQLAYQNTSSLAYARIWELFKSILNQTHHMIFLYTVWQSLLTGRCCVKFT